MKTSLVFAVVGVLRLVGADLTSCLTSANVPYEDSSSSDFSALNDAYNLRLQYTPAAIATPETNQHVSDAVICASENNIKVAARSGGHSYASYSTGGQDGSLVVNLENFQNVTLDNSTGVAAVGGGIRLGNMDLKIYLLGQRALSHGTSAG